VHIKLTNNVKEQLPILWVAIIISGSEGVYGGANSVVLLYADHELL